MQHKYPLLHRALVEVLIEERKNRGHSQIGLSLELSEVSTYINSIENYQHGVSFVGFVKIFESMGADPVEMTRKVLDRYKLLSHSRKAKD